mmetsp:Transcript_756/g.1585  ORF Transcript_756/g.1585 Transcript_756/m.1585 type:complete len:320 (-) Transcript_756:677-1636(-)
MQSSPIGPQGRHHKKNGARSARARALVQRGGAAAKARPEHVEAEAEAEAQRSRRERRDGWTDGPVGNPAENVVNRQGPAPHRRCRSRRFDILAAGAAAVDAAVGTPRLRLALLLLAVDLEADEAAASAKEDEHERDADHRAHGDPNDADDAQRASATRQAGDAAGNRRDAVAEARPDAWDAIGGDLEGPEEPAEGEPEEQETQKPEDVGRRVRLCLQRREEPIDAHSPRAEVDERETRAEPRVGCGPAVDGAGLVPAKDRVGGHAPVVAVEADPRAADAVGLELVSGDRRLVVAVGIGPTGRRRRGQDGRVEGDLPHEL